MAKLTIREAKKKDLKQIVSLFVEIAKDSKFEPDTKYVDNYEEETEKFIKEELAKSSNKILVAEYEKMLVGMVMGHKQGECTVIKNKVYGLIQQLGVTKSMRGQRVADALLEQMSSWLKSEGVNKLILGVHSKNKAAINLYEKLGFEVSGLQMQKDI